MYKYFPMFATSLQSRSMSLLLFVLVLSSIHPISATPANASGFPLTDSSRSVVLDTAETNESYRIMELEEVTVVDLEIVLRKKESSNVTFIREDYIRQNRGGSLMKSLERLPGISTIGIGSGSSKPLIRGLGFNRSWWWKTESNMKGSNGELTTVWRSISTQ